MSHMSDLSPKPTRPTHIPDYADECLTLAERNLGDKISLGGAFALLHYLDYDRPLTWMHGGIRPPHQKKEHR